MLGEAIAAAAAAFRETSSSSGAQTQSDTLPADSGVRAILPFSATVSASQAGGAPANPDSPPTWIDHFELGPELGRGAMGVVFEGWDRSLERRVAIKVVPELSAGDGDARLVAEARAQARLSSPHVVHIYYVGRMAGGSPEQTGATFFAMELVDGGTLADVLSRGERLDSERARISMVEVARGLQAALVAGIVHRDVKPSNVLLDADGHAKIADFGVARPVDRRGLACTASRSPVGTPLYMSPEQARGEPADHRSDMYSLGCTFYHLVTGRPVFEDSNPFRVMCHHATRPAKPIREVEPSVSEPLARIIDRLLEKEPEDRFDSYDELLDQLAAAAPGEVRHAGLAARTAGALMDTVLAALLIRFFGWWGLAVHLAYVAIGHAYFGMTLGKWLMNLQVRRADGTRLGLLRSLLRIVCSLWLPIVLALLMSLTGESQNVFRVFEQIRLRDLDALRHLLLVVFVGNAVSSALYVGSVALAALHPKRRALHDLLAGSEVVYRLG